MATLKDHQQAMVDLLASGSGIPASASRLAHAMHDVLAHMVGGGFILDKKTYVVGEVNDATTPGLDDKALADAVAEFKVDSLCVRPTPAEVRIKQLENTVNQLRESNKSLRRKLDCAENEVMCLRSIVDLPEQAGVRKDDTQSESCMNCQAVTYGNASVCYDCKEPL